MENFVKVKLSNGIVVNGVLVKTEENTIDVRVNTPYYRKSYFDSSCFQTDEMNCNGIKKVIYNNNSSTLTKVKSFTIATIHKSTILSMQ